MKIIDMPTKLIDMLTPLKDHNDEPTYTDEDIRAHATEIVPNTGNILLIAVHITPVDVNHSFVSFVVFHFAMSAIDGTDKMWARVFDGYGYTGSLRELRQSYWGDQLGNVSHPNLRLIISALEALKVYYF